jgi:exopolyphosphatase/guanosine-5'-triphosphate,3'-diphosphate pyrophosphatase
VISEAAIERALAALGICREKMVARNARRLRLIATEACRAASNGDAFRARVADELGIQLEIIDRETEATLAVTGCLPLVDSLADGAILFDIGGGSTELVRLDRPAGEAHAVPRMAGWVSLPLGQHVTRECYAAMVAEVARHLELFTARHGADLGNMHLLGTSGTVTTIAGVFQNLLRYDRRRIDGIWMDNAAVTCVIEQLLGASYSERAGNPCIGPDRADLVLAGCAILDAIRAAFPLSRLRVADRGLREGMLIDMMRQDGVIAAA